MSNKDNEQAERIEGILTNCTAKNVNNETLAIFYELLRQGLSFPCDVIGKVDLERYILYAIENSGDEMFGLLGKLTLLDNQKKECVIPLCDLKAVDNRSLDFILLDDYGTWFIQSQI